MKGEIISLIVCVSWTITALCAEFASKRMGQLSVNVIRMSASLVLLALTMLVVTGSPYPMYADGNAWLWLSMSGFVGYCFGDFCLFNAYIHIGSRYAQLFMTLAPPTAAIASLCIFGETMSAHAVLGMFLTLLGIAMTVYRPRGNSVIFTAKGILFAIGAGVGQGLGLVLSKLGMTYYQECIPADAPEALDIMPFSSTFIRAITGLAGFVVAMLLTKSSRKVFRSLHDGKAMLSMAGATIFGPFIGVSLSLMATLYTNPGIAQTIMSMTPVLILLPTWYLYNQKITWRDILGTIVSVLGVSLFFA